MFPLRRNLGTMWKSSLSNSRLLRSALNVVGWIFLRAAATSLPSPTSASSLTFARRPRRTGFQTHRGRSPGGAKGGYRNSPTSRPLPLMMLLSVPIGMGLLPCWATMTCRPSACRHFWWLPRWSTRQKPFLRNTRTTSWALQMGKCWLKAGQVRPAWRSCAA